MEEPDQDRPQPGNAHVQNTMSGDINGIVVQTGTFTGDVHHHQHVAWAYLKPEKIPPRLATSRPQYCYCRELTAATIETSGAVVAVSGSTATDTVWHWAWENRSLFTEGQLLVDVEKLGESATAADIAGQIFRDLGFSQPTLTEEALLRAYHDIIDHRRVLVVLCNATGAWQVEPLLSSEAVSTLVITSAQPLVHLAAISIDVDSAGSYRFAVLPTESERLWDIAGTVAGLGGLAAVIAVIATWSSHVPVLQAVLTTVGAALAVSLVAFIGKTVYRFFSPYAVSEVIIDHRGISWWIGDTEHGYRWHSLSSAGAPEFVLAALHDYFAEAAVAHPDHRERVLFVQHQQVPPDVEASGAGLLSRDWLAIGCQGLYFVSSGTDSYADFNVICDEHGALVRALTETAPCYLPLPSTASAIPIPG